VSDLIADSARLVGDSISAVSVYRLCGSARGDGRPRTFAAAGSTGRLRCLWWRTCCVPNLLG